MSAFPLRENPRARQMAERFAGGNPPHALLIEGPPGCGKSTLARHLAGILLCRGDDRPCGECASCQKLEKGHPDLLVFESEKKTARSFHVDLVREARTQAFVRPNESEVKVLLLEDCETMTEQAQNALLKVLEEPPDSAVFLLTCNNRSALLETIRSRASCVTLERLTTKACAEELRERIPDRSPQELADAADQALGSVGGALTRLTGEGQEDAHQETARLLLEAMESGDEYGALRLLSSYEKDRPGLSALLEAVRTVSSRRMLEEAVSTRRLQLFSITAIIEEAQAAMRFNVGGLVLGSSLVARCMQVLGDS